MEGKKQLFHVVIIRMRYACLVINPLICSFQPPADDGGSKITRYVIEGRLGNKRSWQQFGRTSSLEFTVSRLQEGEKYSFQVMAENSIGVGEPAELDKPAIPTSKFSTYLRLYINLNLHYTLQA